MSSSDLRKALKWAKRNYDGNMESGTLAAEAMCRFRSLSREDARTVARNAINDYHGYTHDNNPYGLGLNGGSLYEEP